MNKHRFKQVVKEFHNLPSEDRDKLHELVKVYPYSQIIHTLVAKANNDASTNIAKQSLNYAAMYTTDRTVLKSIMESRPIEAEIVTTAETVPQESHEEAQKVDEKGQTIVAQGTKVTVDDAALTKSADDLAKQVWAGLEALKVSKALYLETTSKQAETPTKRTSTTKKTATKRATSTTTASKASPGSKAVTKKTSTAQTGASAKSKSTTASKPRSSKTTSKTKTTGKTTTAAAKASKTTTTKAKTKTSTSSKSTTTKKTASSKKAESPTRRKASKASGGTSSKSASSAPSKKKASPKGQTGLRSQKEIIEQFIDKEPRISSKKPADANTAQKDLSVQSTSFGENLISENLAQILAAQGKTKKAIDIYKKLIWKFPQKKSYFAGLIEDLQK